LSPFSIDAVEFDRQSWLSVGLGPTDVDALRDYFKNALDIFINHYRQRFSTLNVTASGVDALDAPEKIEGREAG
jgi:hypothetical protein